MSDIFHFKQFSVHQDRCAMKVGTDGVLLGALADCGPESSVLDIGTGTGIVALMLAQRHPEARIVGVDIDADAAAQAAENFAASVWADRLTAVCADARKFESSKVQYDNIVCNPPYYAHSPASSSQARDAARRADTLTLEELADTASRLLCDDGRLEVIIPFSATDDFIHICWLHGLHLMRRINIRTKVDKPFKRSVLAFTKTNVYANHSVPDTLALGLFNDDGTPTDEYRTLTADFYIKL
ncbi:MAG: methyltransferase [Bacteroidaceae bacterium]|nr:methyltransferase [Bacteroidaceae bacterium]